MTTPISWAYVLCIRCGKSQHPSLGWGLFMDKVGSQLPYKCEHCGSPGCVIEAHPKYTLEAV